MNKLVVSLALVGVSVGSAGAQDIVGRKETTFNINEKVASGEWLRIASPNGSISLAQ